MMSLTGGCVNNMSLHEAFGSKKLSPSLSKSEEDKALTNFGRHLGVPCRRYIPKSGNLLFNHALSTGMLSSTRRVGDRYNMRRSGNEALIMSFHRRHTRCALKSSSWLKCARTSSRSSGVFSTASAAADATGFVVDFSSRACCFDIFVVLPMRVDLRRMASLSRLVVI